jgi:pimeloyl-ACP methyl ester carboxylesterase
MSFARVNNCDIYYELHGSGPPLVLVHGETHGTILFENQIPHFSQTHRCLIYDRRGHGKSEVPPYGYSLWNQTQDLVCLLDHLKIEEAIIVAVAMSTTIATTFALQYPERVRALVLCSWYELDGYPALEQRRRTQIMTFADLHLKMFDVMQRQGRQGLVDFLDKNSATLMPIFPLDKPAVRKKLIDLFASHHPEHYIKSAEFYTSMPNIRAQMDGLRCPVLGICGTEDPSPDKPELLNNLPNFRQAWVIGARRFTMMEYPDEFNKVLDEFIAGVN